MKERESNFELLRGVLMFMIICVHITGNGVLKGDDLVPITCSSWFSANIIDSFCYCCVNTFVLISGYFGIRPALKKYLNLDVPVIMYSLLFLFLLNDISIKGFYHSLFPTLSNSYWFLTQYFLLYLISPFLNNFIDRSSKRVLGGGIIVGGVLFVIVPSFLRLNLAECRGMDFVSFSVLYLIGRFISKYNIKIDKQKCLLAYLMLSIVILLATLLLGYQFGINRGWKSPFYAYNFILVYLQSISLFLFFKNVKFKNKFVNFVSPSFFYIYIIHTNPSVHKYIYNWLHCSDYYFSDYYILHTLFAAAIIFIGCIIIDLVIRRLLFTKINDYIVKVCESIVANSKLQLDKYYK